MGSELNLGDLVVQISTDLTNFNKGLQEAEKQVKNTMGKITDMTNNIGKALTVAGVAITGTFALMTKSVLAYNEEIYRLSEQTGISTETLNRLKYVADQNESSIEAVAMGLKFLSRNMYEAASGSQQAENKFNSLNISFANADGSLRKAEDVLLDVANKFKGMSNETEKSALSMELFGRQGTALIPVLNLGADGIKKAADEAARLGGSLGETKSKVLDTLGDTLLDIHKAMNGLWTEIVQLMAPALTNLAKKVTDAIVSFRQFAEAHPELTKAMVSGTLAFGAFALVVGPLILLLTSFLSNIAMISIAVTALGISISTVLLVALNGVGLALVSIAGLGVAAFVGWNIGRLIGEVTGLDNALSGPNGLFTRMFEWLDKILPKLERFASFMWGGGNLPALDAINAEAAAAEGGGQAVGSSDAVTAARNATIQELAEINQKYYDGMMELRQMDLQDAVNELDALRMNEEYSYEQRQAYAINYFNYRGQLWVQDANNAYQVIHTVSSTISSNFASMIVGAQSFADAWKNIWQSLGTYIIEQVLNKIIEKLMEVLAIDQMITGVLSWIGLETGGMITESGNKAPIPQAKEGLFLEGGGPTPVLIHPPEVIMPLDKFKEMAGVGGGGISVTYNHYGDITSEVDIEDVVTRIGQRVKDAVREK